MCVRTDISLVPRAVPRTKTKTNENLLSSFVSFLSLFMVGVGGGGWGGGDSGYMGLN